LRTNDFVYYLGKITNKTSGVESSSFNAKTIALQTKIRRIEMKIKVIFFMFCVLAITPAAFAQNTVELFEAVPIKQGTPSGPPYNFNTAYSFGTAYVSCPTGATGTISGPLAEGGFIVDNFLTVNGTNVCPGGPEGNCFSSAPGPFVVGSPAETAFKPVAPINISNILGTGGIFTFNLMDYGGFYGSTDVNLTNTNCQLIPQTEEGKFAVCHRQGGNGKNVKYKTLYVGDLDSVRDHLNHGDQPGACRTETP
jgi:hypothetical protein